MLRINVFLRHGCPGRPRERAISFIEVLAAVLILSIVATSAVATWTLSSKVPATMRRTELASKLAVNEVERIKAQKYTNLPTGTTSTTNWYDKYGGYLGTGTTAISGWAYKAVTTVSVAPGTASTSSTKDLVQVQAVISNTSSVTLETQQTLMTFGGF